MVESGILQQGTQQFMGDRVLGSTTASTLGTTGSFQQVPQQQTSGLMSSGVQQQPTGSSSGIMGSLSSLGQQQSGLQQQPMQQQSSLVGQQQYPTSSGLTSGTTTGQTSGYYGTPSQQGFQQQQPLGSERFYTSQPQQISSSSGIGGTSTFQQPQQQLQQQQQFQPQQQFQQQQFQPQQQYQQPIQQPQFVTPLTSSTASTFRQPITSSTTTSGGILSSSGVGRTTSGGVGGVQRTGEKLDGFDMLLQDQKDILELYENHYLLERDMSHKRQILNLLIEELCIHSSVDEVIVFPLLEFILPDGKRLAERNYWQHLLNRIHFQKILEMDTNDKLFESSVEHMMIYMKEQLKMNEFDIYARARQRMSSDQLAVLYRLVEAARQLAPTTPRDNHSWFKGRIVEVFDDLKCQLKQSCGSSVGGSDWKQQQQQQQGYSSSSSSFSSSSGVGGSSLRRI